MNDFWMISNRQPWPYALINNLITTKTRSMAVTLPPVGSIVFLHASKATWSGWRELWWINELGIHVPNLPRGCVVGYATVKKVGETDKIMPKKDRRYFEMDSWSCADLQGIVFKDIQSIEPIYCKGSLVPTRKLPKEIHEYIDNHFGD